MYPNHSEDLDEFIDLADHALYEAKQLSKNNYKISTGNGIPYNL